MDLLADMQKQLADRLAELKPAVEEHRRLEEAQAALATTPTAPRRSRPRDDPSWDQPYT